MKRGAGQRAGDALPEPLQAIHQGGGVVGDYVVGLAGVDAVLSVPLVVFHPRVAVHEVV